MLQQVVIADDSSTARMIIRRCLEIAGCVDTDFKEVADGEQAMKLMHEHDVDLLITDLNMPKIDGRTLLKHTKATPELTEIPVVVISSASNQAIENQLMAEGVLAVVQKPVSPASVADALQKVTKETEWGRS